MVCGLDTGLREKIRAKIWTPGSEGDGGKGMDAWIPGLRVEAGVIELPGLRAEAGWGVVCGLDSVVGGTRDGPRIWAPGSEGGGGMWMSGFLGLRAEAEAEWLGGRVKAGAGSGLDSWSEGQDKAPGSGLLAV